MAVLLFRRFSFDFLTLGGGQMSEAAHPQDQLPDLLRPVMLSESWHPGEGHTVGYDKVNFRVRHLLGIASKCGDSGVESGIQPVGAATVESVARGAMGVVLSATVCEVLGRRRYGIFLIPGVKLYLALAQGVRHTRLEAAGLGGSAPVHVRHRQEDC